MCVCARACNVCVCVCVCVCVFGDTHIYLYICMFDIAYLCIERGTIFFFKIYERDTCMHVCMYVCMYICIYVCIYTPDIFILM
jgi:hypothetical protein